MVQVPWQRDRPDMKVSPTPASKSGNDAEIREDVIPVLDIDATARKQTGPPQPVISERGTPNPYVQPVIGQLIHAKEIVLLDHGASSNVVAPAMLGPISSAAPDSLGIKENLGEGDPPNPAGEGINDGEAMAGTTSAVKRKLSAKHFQIALDEIRPSSSEEGSLPELRKVSACDIKQLLS